MPEPLDATVRDDLRAALLRQWYEAHRETWWSRCFLSAAAVRLHAGAADEFALGLAHAARAIDTMPDAVLRDAH